MMRRTVLAAFAAISIGLAAAGAARAADLSNGDEGAIAPYGADYPRVPRSTVDAEHYDWPQPGNFYYRKTYGDIGGYGFPPNLTSDDAFVPYTPVFPLPHDGGYADGDPMGGDPMGGGHMGHWRARGFRHGHRMREGRVGTPSRIRVADGSLHYIVPDYAGGATLAPDGATYRTVRKAHYVNAYETPPSTR